jgi:hypothetical protein
MGIVILKILSAMAMLSWSADTPAVLENSAISEAKEFDDLASAQSTEQEILPAGEYVEFSELDPVPSDMIEWSPNSGRFLYVTQGSLPYVYFMGKLAPGHELMFQNQFVQIDPERREFSLKVPLQLKPTLFEFRVVTPEGKVCVFQLINYWLSRPSTFSFKVKTQQGVEEIGKSFYSRFESSAFVQLYSKHRPARTVDLDALKHAALSFRVYAPPIREEVYDGWELVVKDRKSRVVARVVRYGYPPPYVDWREVGLVNLAPGQYSYQMNLLDQGKKHEGPSNVFQTFEGTSIVVHDFFPLALFEPRGELGHYQFKNKQGLSYSGFYLWGDVSVLIRRKYLIRGSLSGSANSGAGESSNLANGRIGLGVRLFGEKFGWLGSPFRYRVDLLATYSSTAVSPEASNVRFTFGTLLIEPHMVIWGRHYLTPWIELGSHPSLNTQKLTFGFGYNFHVRTWPLRLGLRISYDWLFRSKNNPLNEFSVLRTGLSFGFDI